MPSIYQPRRPRASPLWQLLTAAWEAFLATYEKKHRPTLGTLRPNVFTAVRNFLRCGDLASGFLRFHCPDCGLERLLAFTCKGRHLCPACHQRRVRQTADWIATAVCHEIPHRQFVFTIPKILRGIFRKRRDLLHLLFKTATDTLQEIFRARLNLPDGKLGAIAAVHTFGDYLIFHPHLRSGQPLIQRPSPQKQIPSIDAAAVQWAIWETTTESLTSQSLSTGDIRIIGTANASLINLANQYLANVNTDTPATLTYLTNSTYQNVVTWNSVPEPTSALLGGLFCLLLLRRRRA